MLGDRMTARLAELLGSRVPVHDGDLDFLEAPVAGNVFDGSEQRSPYPG
jgi:hypothetical protein